MVNNKKDNIISNICIKIYNKYKFHKDLFQNQTPQTCISTTVIYSMGKKQTNNLISNIYIKMCFKYNFQYFTNLFKTYKIIDKKRRSSDFVENGNNLFSIDKA